MNQDHKDYVWNGVTWGYVIDFNKQKENIEKDPHYWKEDIKPEIKIDILKQYVEKKGRK